MDYISVGKFRNNTEQDLIISLEPMCEEIHLSQHDVIELFVDDEKYAPITLCYYNDNNLQVYAEFGISNTWYFSFQGKMYTAGYTSKLSELRE